MNLAYSRQVQQSDAHLVTAAFARLIQAALRLLHDISIGRAGRPQFDDVYDLLGAVPLGTEEHSLSAQRLRNAMQYAARGEIGAARYELNMLVHCFTTLGQIQVIE
jgi:hypothetical protein